MSWPTGIFMSCKLMVISTAPCNVDHHAPFRFLTARISNFFFVWFMLPSQQPSSESPPIYPLFFFNDILTSFTFLHVAEVSNKVCSLFSQTVLFSHGQTSAHSSESLTHHQQWFSVYSNGYLWKRHFFWHQGLTRNFLHKYL